MVKTSSSIPTVRFQWPWELAAAARAIESDLLGFVGRHFEQHGDRVRVVVGTRSIYRSRSADDAQQLLLENAKAFAKPERGLGVDPLKTLLGDENLLLSNGEAWRRRRRTVQPMLLRSRVVSYQAVMREVAREHVARLPPAGTVDLHGFFQELTLDLVCRLLFDLPAGPYYATVRDLLVEVQALAAKVATLPGWAPTPANLRYKSAVKRLRAVIDHLIDERLELGRAALEARNDVLSTLCLTFDAPEPAPLDAAEIHRDTEEAARFTREEIRNELLTLFLAGHDTTSLTLTWTAYEVGRRPAVEERLHAEIVAEGDGDRPYLKAVLDEGLRLHPPALAVIRETLEPVRLGPYEVPAGRNIAVWTMFVQRHPALWAEPNTFVPERWLDAAEPSPGSYFPFGAGTRTCIGKHFALQEAAIILEELSRAFHVDTRETPPPAYATAPTLTPRGGLPARVTLRAERRLAV